MKRLACLFFTFMMGCATQMAQQALESRRVEIQLNTEAWLAAREKLSKECPNPLSRLVAGLRRPTEFSAQVLDSPEAPERLLSPSLFSEPPIIQDRARGCGLRIVKLSNRYALDDWGYDWLPDYSTIVRTHEAEMKTRRTPKVYEEYMLALSHYLAQEMDQKRITPRQMIRTFNEGWRWMVQRLQEEIEILQRRVDEARIADMQALNNFAQAFAIAAGAALVAGASSGYSTPRPSTIPSVPLRQRIFCQARPGGWNTVTGQLYSINIDCR